MRIDAYNQVSQIYQNTKVKAAHGVKKSKVSDAFEISQAGKDYQTAVQAVKEADDIREDKVNKIKAQLASGTYNVTGEEFADKMVEHLFNTMI